MSTLDFTTFEPKLGSWAQKFKKFVEGQEMWDIYQKIKEDAKKERILPDSKDTFKAFQKTDLTNIKCVWYLMDPYPRVYKGGIPQATGIPMDCSNSPDGKLQPSLEKWYDGISAELGRKVTYSPSLDYLLEQGILLLNTDLTVKKDKTQSHEGLWEPFMKYFLEEVMGTRTGIVYVLAGKASKRLAKYIPPFSHTFEVEHPAAASHKNTDWDTKGIFKKISTIIKQNNGIDIFWDKKDWDIYKEPPF